jgi:hypothetical protein
VHLAQLGPIGQASSYPHDSSLNLQPVPSQTFDAMLRNRAYVAQIDVPDFGISIRDC